MSIDEVYSLFQKNGVETTHYTIRKWCRENKLDACIPEGKKSYDVEEKSVFMLLKEKIIQKQSKNKDYTKGFSDGFEKAMSILKEEERMIGYNVREAYAVKAQTEKYLRDDFIKGKYGSFAYNYVREESPVFYCSLGDQLTLENWVSEKQDRFVRRELAQIETRMDMAREDPTNKTPEVILAMQLQQETEEILKAELLNEIQMEIADYEVELTKEEEMPF